MLGFGAVSLPLRLYSCYCWEALLVELTAVSVEPVSGDVGEAF